MKQWDMLDVLRHYRHDRLNDLQLIKGYLKIGRLDKVEAIVELVVQQAFNESRLSSMGFDQFAKRLISYNWESRPFIVQYEVSTEDPDWSMHENDLVSLFNLLSDIFDGKTAGSVENELLINLSETDGKYVEFDFHGKLIDIKAFEEELQQLKKVWITRIEQFTWSEESFYMKLRLT
ncbi:Spo0B domain-containing protein [Paenalkalicoccus suaedae]|uniref:Spo0B domain-containing protein n=1 Tax=Paenalkalicoccus suaedae TaxID=2592382 RepID=A0A859FD43_9BACI|nr:Spo0B C-terminal domain-containing protein [Paenalkalicoccus suaedae]QKS70758.1 Spo0B domain-containing protein [Paenalkalicoccus suaedae]